MPMAMGTPISILSVVSRPPRDEVEDEEDDGEEDDVVDGAWFRGAVVCFAAELPEVGWALNAVDGCT